MPRALPELERRNRALRATLARFDGKPFAWGRNDCARMVAFALRKLGRPIPMAKAGSYKTALGARAALKRMGHAGLEALFDSERERIAPAMALPCDVLLIPGDEGFGALALQLTNGRAFMFHEDSGAATVVQPDPAQIIGAWRA